MKPIFLRAALGGLVIAAGAGLVSSCKDYLDIDPTASYTSEVVFSSVAGATSAVIGAYDPLSGDNSYGQRVSLYFPYDTDEMIGSQGTFDTGRRGIARYRAFPSNIEITNPWNTLYQGVERSNICIQQIPKMALYTNGTAADTAALHRLHGEVLTLRAQYYYELIRNWGDVPAQFEPSVAGQDFNLPNTDRNATLDRLLDDLVLAQRLLPWRSRATPSNERITKGAAKALRARIALARGGYSLRGKQMQRPADYQNYYRIALEECRQLMAQRGEHTLNPNYSSLFRNINEQKPDPSNEIMFEVAMAGNSAASDSKLGYYNGPRLNSSPTLGNTNGAVTIAPPYFYAFDSTDVRRDITITTYIVSATDARTGTALSAVTDGKFRRDWHVPAVPGTGNYLGYNWPVIRFADVLLMFAEAENELSGPTTAARNALLEVRTRGFGGNAARAAAGLNTSSKEAMFETIVNERSLEFGSEGIRKYDLLRWNLFATKIAEAKAKIEAIRDGLPPYQNVPNIMYYRVVNGQVQWGRSFYKPSPATAPMGTTAVNWRAAINAQYALNTRPNGTSVMSGSTPLVSTGAGLAAEYLPDAGKELLPIPQSTLDADKALVQNEGY